MKYFICLIIVAVLCLFIPTAIAHDAPPTPKIKEVELTPKQYIELYAKRYNVSASELLAVAKCESKLNPKAINYNDGGKGKHSVGIFQFQKFTFNAWSKKMGLALNYYSYHDQIRLASWMFSKGQQKQWSCYKKIYT